MCTWVGGRARVLQLDVDIGQVCHGHTELTRDDFEDILYGDRPESVTPGRTYGYNTSRGF